MNLNERFDVSPAKVAELRERILRLGVRLDAVAETFSRGGGKGGQKRDKTSNRVTLSYPPLGLTIHAQADRRRGVNRFLALRELVDRIEMRLSPGTSARLAAFEAERRRKARRAARSRLKRGAVRPAEAPAAGGPAT